MAALQVPGAFVNLRAQTTFSGSAGMPFSRPGLNLPQAVGIAAVKDGLVLPRPPRVCAARSVLEGGGLRRQPQGSRAGWYNA